MDIRETLHQLRHAAHEMDRIFGRWGESMYWPRLLSSTSAPSMQGQQQPQQQQAVEGAGAGDAGASGTAIVADSDRSLFGRWASMPVALDVRETDNAYQIDAEVPGMRKEDIHVDLNEGVLTISGERQQSEERKSDRVHVMERCWGKFSRSMRLPRNADPESIAATYKDGVLSVSLQKKPVPETKKIPIQ